MKKRSNYGERARSDEQRSAVRRQLCSAAEELLLSEGEGALTMRRLSAKVGYSAMALYRYFPDKEALIASIRAQAFSRLADALDEVSSDGRDQAGNVGDTYIAFARANPGTYKLMFDLDQPDDEVHPELAAAVARGRKIMARYVDQMIAAGKLAGDPVVLSNAFWASLHGLLTLDLTGHLPENPGFDVLRRGLMSSLMRGFSPARLDEPSEGN